MSFVEMVYWNNNSYGSALRVPKRFLRAVLVAFCIVTPATNWIIPFAARCIRSDLVMRY